MTSHAMQRYSTLSKLIRIAALPLVMATGWVATANAQDRPFWDQGEPPSAATRRARPQRNDAYTPPPPQGPAGGFGSQAEGYDSRGSQPPTDTYGNNGYGNNGPSRGYEENRGGAPYGGGGYAASPGAPRPNDAYAPPGQNGRPGWGDGYQSAPPTPDRAADRAPEYREDPRYSTNDGRGYQQPSGPAYGQPYAPPPVGSDDGRAYDQRDRGPYAGQETDRRRWDDRQGQGTYSRNEVLNTGHKFFGSISQGLANAVEYVFQRSGRPNGYILGEDAGGAFIAGLRFGEGTLYTKDTGNHRVYWQGPSLGYDFGGEGSKTMVLVYNLRDPSDIYERFGGVQGAAYLIGGVSVQFQKHGDVALAVIRSGVGLRLGANVGYLKYTRNPTWNPF